MSTPTQTETFWSLAEAAERGVVGDRSSAVGVVRHVLDVLAALEAGRSANPIAQSTLAFLGELEQRLAGGDLSASDESIGDHALVFSTGLLLLESFIGRHPLGAVEAPHRLGRLSADELAAMVARASEVPPAVRGILLRALGPNQPDRFTSVAAMRAELEWFVASETEQQRGGTLVTPMPLPSLTPSMAENGVVRARAPTPPTGSLAMTESVPAVLIAEDAHIAQAPRSNEHEVETAMVPRWSQAALSTPESGIGAMEAATLYDDRNGQTGRTHVERVSEPEPEDGGATLRLVVITLGLLLLSGAVTAMVLMYLRR